MASFIAHTVNTGSNAPSAKARRKRKQCFLLVGVCCCELLKAFHRLTHNYSFIKYCNSGERFFFLPQVCDKEKSLLEIVKSNSV